MTNLIAQLIITLSTNIIPIDVYAEALDGETVSEFLQREIVAVERVFVVREYYSRVIWKGRVVDTLLQSELVETYDRNRATTLFEIMKTKDGQ